MTGEKSATDKEAENQEGQDSRFDKLALIASPYVAGPYVEGDYEIELAITPDIVAGLKQEYRGSFEVGQPPQ